MSVTCGLECVVCMGCSRWAWKRLAYGGNYDSETWPKVTAAAEFEAVPRMCRAVLAVYESDLANPRFLPAAGDCCIDPSCVVKRVDYSQISDGRCPPYIIYVDRRHRELVLAVRGLNLVRESDYKVLLDNRLGRQMFDGGYVHHGLLQAAIWLLNQEGETLRQKLAQLGPDYKLVFAGHSLGSGIVALMTIVVANHRQRFGGILRSQIRCYCLAPARCMSLNLAVKYADVITSVILQDDFLPRTPTPLEHIFGSIFCLPCFLFIVCMRDTFIPEKRKLKDPRRLYVPGRIYHIVDRKSCRCGRYPPEVRTAIPVEGRFDHIVLSGNATSDHAIIWIEREATKALEILKQNAEIKISAVEIKLERKLSQEQEHKVALKRALTLNIPHAVFPHITEQTETPNIEEQTEMPNIEEQTEMPNIEEQTDSSCTITSPEDRDGKFSGNMTRSSGRANWDELVAKLFDRSQSGNLVLRKDININD